MNRALFLLFVMVAVCLAVPISSSNATEVNPCNVEICSFGEVAVELYVSDNCDQDVVAGRGFLLMESYYTGNYVNVIWGEFNTAYLWTDYAVVDFDGDRVNELVTLNALESDVWADVHNFNYVDSQVVWAKTSIPEELSHWLDDVTSVETEGDSLVVYGFQYGGADEDNLDKVIVIKASESGDAIEFYGAYLEK